MYDEGLAVLAFILSLALALAVNNGRKTSHVTRIAWLPYTLFCLFFTVTWVTKATIAFSVIMFCCFLLSLVYNVLLGGIQSELP
jgi:hypothetical protein